MNVLCIGDIVGKAGRHALEGLLPELKKEYDIAFTIANGENAAGGAGLTPRIAGQLCRAGCDFLTLGDHTWDKHELIEYLQEEANIIRPANFPEGTPGKGWAVVNAGDHKIGIVNLLGRVFMRYNVDCPFRALQKIVAEIKKETNIIFVDFHAETTSEKIALGHFIDGDVTAVFGTHTHIQTADAKILAKGTAHITDLGMTGPYDSVIGQNKDKIIQRFCTGLPVRFEVAQDDPQLCGVVVKVDTKTGLAKKITPIQRRLT
ncbi:MAG: TIGR00282 family metallophosphoesterase [Candidatus Omnitrophica bacterium]|nr:TIGR00282 family metallophosphoesterase [Candidatus Omnitrophota bacterium]